MSDLRAPKVIVVMPARQAAATLEQTFAAIPTDVVDEVILVDDHSTDDTVRLARELPLHLVWHPHQTGYGANQKTCYLEALQRDADVVVMLHPDGQYEPELIPSMIEPIVSGEADLVLGLAPAGAGRGARGRHAALEVPGQPLPDHVREPHHGHRTSRRPTRATGPTRAGCCSRCRSCATRSTSSFDSELLMQAAHFGFTIKEVPARCRYFEDASSVGFRSGAVYGMKTLRAGVRLRLHRLGVRSRKFES